LSIADILRHEAKLGKALEIDRLRQVLGR